MNQNQNQNSKPPKPPADPYGQRGKTLTSTVQKLRGWVGSDPSRTPELADALVEVTAHRLLGHGYAAAALDAQESLRRAAELLTANGPIGPYTSVADAARYGAAVVQLATVQAAVGQPDAAGRTVASLWPLQQQLHELGLQQQVDLTTAIWALSCTARAALASGDVAEANAGVDAASVCWATLGRAEEQDWVYLPMDLARLASDCRWAAGRVDDALAYLQLAVDRYDALTGRRLREPARLSPPLVERLAEPLFAVYRDLADRLTAVGETDLGLVTRRTLVELLRGLAPRLGGRTPVQLAAALADLARDLLSADRVDEADAATSDAMTTVLDWSGAEPTRLVVAATRARALTRAGRADEAAATLRQVVDSAAGPPSSAADAVVLLALAEALEASGEVDGAAATRQAYGELVAELLPDTADAAAADSAISDLARGVVSRGPTVVTWSPRPPDDSFIPSPETADLDDLDAREVELRRETAGWLAAARADAHDRELERIEQARTEADREHAEQRAAERAAAEQRAAERAAAEQAERLEAERLAAAEEAERLDRKRRREARLEAHRLEAERLEAERLEAERLAETEADHPEPRSDPVEAERLELERLQAELDALERAAQPEPRPVPVEGPSHPEAAPQPEPAAGPAAPAPRHQHDEEKEESLPEPVEGPSPLEPAPLEPAPLEPAPQSTDPAPPSEPVESPLEALALARQAWQEARSSGDRRKTRAANEQLVELLRPHADADPASVAPVLREALDALATARLRSGDIFGSRAAAREAKAWARRLGR